MRGWKRSSEFITIATNNNESCNNNNKLKGLFICSNKETLYTKDYLQETLRSFVRINNNYITTNKDYNYETFLSQLDRIGCEELNNYEKNILNNYDILFIGKEVTFPEIIIYNLKELISLKKIAIVFLDANNNYLLKKLNYLKSTIEENFNFLTNFSENTYFHLNLNIVTKLTKYKSLQEFYFKNILNNYNNNNEFKEWITINLGRTYCMNMNCIDPQSITKLNDWYLILKNKEDKINILLHKQDKILCFHNTTFYKFENQMSRDLFYYFIKYLLLEFKSEKDILFKKNLFSLVNNNKLIDVIFE